jgi:hypothetical protein
MANDVGTQAEVVKKAFVIIGESENLLLKIGIGILEPFIFD